MFNYLAKCALGYASMKSYRILQSSMKKLIILGIRGIPARHGGFETFAEKTIALSSPTRMAGYSLLSGKWYRQHFYKRLEWYSAYSHSDRKRWGRGTIFFDWKATVHALGKCELF